MIATTPRPPYYAVIFTSILNENTEDYIKTTEKMLELSKKTKGFLGIESARDTLGITISYWESIEAIKKWRENTDHVMAQKEGKEKWYSNYKVRICKVERDYKF